MKSLYHQQVRQGSVHTWSLLKPALSIEALQWLKPGQLEIGQIGNAWYLAMLPPAQQATIVATSDLVVTRLLAAELWEEMN